MGLQSGTPAVCTPLGGRERGGIADSTLNRKKSRCGSDGTKKKLLARSGKSGEHDLGWMMYAQRLKEMGGFSDTIVMKIPRHFAAAVLQGSSSNNIGGSGTPDLVFSETKKATQ